MNLINLIHTSGALYYIYLCVKKYTSWWFSLGTRFSNWSPQNNWNVV